MTLLQSSFTVNSIDLRIIPWNRIRNRLPWMYPCYQPSVRRSHRPITWSLRGIGLQGTSSFPGEKTFYSSLSSTGVDPCVTRTGFWLLLRPWRSSLEVYLMGLISQLSASAQISILWRLTVLTKSNTIKRTSKMQLSSWTNSMLIMVALRFWTLWNTPLKWNGTVRRESSCSLTVWYRTNNKLLRNPKELTAWGSTLSALETTAIWSLLPKWRSQDEAVVQWLKMTNHTLSVER